MRLEITDFELEDRPKGLIYRWDNGWFDCSENGDKILKGRLKSLIEDSGIRSVSSGRLNSWHDISRQCQVWEACFDSRAWTGFSDAG